MKKTARVRAGPPKTGSAKRRPHALTEAAEDYLRTILELQKFGPVHCVAVAEARGVAKASVTVAVQKLRSQGYLKPDTPTLELTDAGRRLAQGMHERSRFFARLLETAGVDQTTADEDACRMEHALSDRSFAALKSCLEERLAEEETDSPPDPA